MKINLEEHKVYVDSLKMEMVPLTIAVKALEQCAEAAAEVNVAYQSSVEEAFKKLEESIKEIKLDD